MKFREAFALGFGGGFRFHGPIWPILTSFDDFESTSQHSDMVHSTRLSPVYFLPLRILRPARISAHSVEHWHGTAWKDGRSLLLRLVPCDRNRFLAKSVGCVVSLPWLARLDCHLARLPLQTLRILHLPGNEISKLEDRSPRWGVVTLVSKQPSCGCKKMIFTCMGEYWRLSVGTKRLACWLFFPSSTERWFPKGDPLLQTLQGLHNMEQLRELVLDKNRVKQQPVWHSLVWQRCAW